MTRSINKEIPGSTSQPSVFGLLKPYKTMIAFLILFALLSNGVNLLLPKIIARGIDAFSAGHFVFRAVILEFLIAALVIFIFTYLQSIIQTYASERVARDHRGTKGRPAHRFATCSPWHR